MLASLMEAKKRREAFGFITPVTQVVGVVESLSNIAVNVKSLLAKPEKRSTVVIDRTPSNKPSWVEVVGNVIMPYFNLLATTGIGLMLSNVIRTVATRYFAQRAQEAVARQQAEREEVEQDNEPGLDVGRVLHIVSQLARQDSPPHVRNMCNAAPRCEVPVQNEPQASEDDNDVNEEPIEQEAVVADVHRDVNEE